MKRESSLSVCAQLNKKKPRNLDVGCSAVAVITIWNQFVVSTKRVALMVGFSGDVYLTI